VDSGAFAAVAYRRGERQLYVRFRSGKICRYIGFPPDRYDELLAADSKGTYFAEHIRGKFLYEEVGKTQLGRIWSIPPENRPTQNQPNRDTAALRTPGNLGFAGADAVQCPDRFAIPPDVPQAGPAFPRNLKV
jgi:hypothetical protein